MSVTWIVAQLQEEPGLIVFAIAQRERPTAGHERLANRPLRQKSPRRERPEGRRMCKREAHHE